MGSQRLKVQAQDLQRGDFLPASKRTIVDVYRHGLKVPSGKVEIVYTRADGSQPAKAMWDKTTLITVERAS